ncbi:MAG: primosomal protein N' [Candidatus Riflebacteria bacterium]|nr:primosomal protein N' [Candidatus Riflebacteria bacterium]
MKLFLGISFPLPLPKNPLTYSFTSGDFPPAIGARVIAPIRGRSQMGYIETISEVEPEFETREIAEIIDPCPFFSSEMLELAKWMADSTLSSFGDVLHAMLPAGVKSGITAWIRLNKNEEPLKQTDTDSFSEALEWLSSKDEFKLSEFSRKYPQAVRHLKTWQNNRVIEIEYRRKETAGYKTQKVLIISDKTEIKPDELTPKEKIAVETLLRNQEPLSQSELLRKSGVSSSPVKNLIKKGLIQIVEQQISRNIASSEYYNSPPEKENTLTENQISVLEKIHFSANTDLKPVLIRGVTCSGKTEVYLKWVAEVIQNGASAIVLVPEITLTPQMVKRFLDRFGNRVAILHSKLSDGERFDQWEGIRLGKFNVVVGARSAVFAPVQKLGTIIIDEEGEPSYKQTETPRYHARDVAEKRCSLEKALLILGSATPTLESYNNALENKYLLVEMTERVTERFPPNVEIVDMRNELTVKNNRSMFSERLTKAIKETLDNRSQVILFLNRRGHSTFVFCRACGESVSCSKCMVSMVYHTGSEILRCHYCGEIKALPSKCPKCSNSAIRFFGGGTQRVEAETRRYFPKARIERMDSDTVTAKGSLENILDRFGKGETDILIGTQMIAKGLDFPNVTLVGILAADSLLKLPDFRASERNFCLLAQVSGRAGRGEKPGKVILQTYSPDHHSIRYSITENYVGFFNEECSLRKVCFYPPFCHIALFTFSGKDNATVINAANSIVSILKTNSILDEHNVLGPAPAPIEKIDGNFRHQIMVKHKDLMALSGYLNSIMSQTRVPDVRISICIDPYISL